ncbi:MAG: ATP-binding cassette domain-containing protein [Candidatus Puniceispirillales bacterium]
MTPQTPLLDAENLTVRYQDSVVLDQVSVSLMPHDFITIVGPNGAGKTTLLKCLAGLVSPTSGTLRRRPGLNLRYIPQRMQVEPSMPMTVDHFLRLNNKDGVPHLAATAEETGITPLLARPLHGLSGGEWQRVLLSRCLMTTPDAIILDEPAQNLDISGQLQFYAQLEKIHQERGIAIVMVSHDLHMVMASTRQVICLYHHICCSGEPTAVARDPEFIQLFGDDMARMMAVYQHHHDHHHNHDHGDHSHA